jgi:hypothetical protein
VVIKAFKYNEAKDVLTSMALLLRKKPWWLVPILLSHGEHISRPECMGEQQA